MGMWYSHQYAAWNWGPASLGFGPFGMALFVGLASILAIAIIALKGYSLWNAARRGEKWWFFFLLIVNTAGILELVYIFAVLKKRPWEKHPGQTPPPAANQQ